MYQTLYRKYRPKNLDEVVGQNIIVRTLKNAIMNDKITHAYLFTGPRGTGKTSVAKILAKTINCINLKDTNPCNKCTNCIQNKQNSIDIIEIDAASNNGVDEIRELKSKVNLVPSLNKYKIYIIDEVHMLTTGAFNALLKTLEEPPQHIIFILATTEPHKIPTTILSRCQRFDFKRIADIDIVNRLKYICKQEKIKINDDCLREIARLSNGGMRDSLSMLDQAISYCDNDITMEEIHEINGTLTPLEIKIFVKNIFNIQTSEVFKKIDTFNDNGKDFVKLSEEILNYLKNLLIKHTVPEYFEKLNLNNEDYDINIKDENEIIIAIEKISDQISKMKLSNNQKLIFEIGLIKLIGEFDNKLNLNIQNEELQTNDDIKQENKIQEAIETNNTDENDYLKQLEKIRINNTLCNFDKKELITIKKELEKVNQLLIDPEYCEAASMILDGTLKAYGKNNLIFVYKNKHDSNMFNMNILKIQKMLKFLLNDDYIIIATDEENWNKIKEQFNKKLKQFTYMKEPKELIQKLNNDTNMIDSTFGNIVNYK